MISCVRQEVAKVATPEECQDQADGDEVAKVATPDADDVQKRDKKPSKVAKVATPEPEVSSDDTPDPLAGIKSFAAQVEDLLEEILAVATPDQLSAVKLTLEVYVRKCARAIKEKSTKDSE